MTDWCDYCRRRLFSSAVALHAASANDVEMLCWAHELSLGCAQAALECAYARLVVATPARKYTRHPHLLLLVLYCAHKTRRHLMVSLDCGDLSSVSSGPIMTICH